MDALDQLLNDSAPTTWKTIIASIFYYITLPVVVSFTTILNILLVIFAPIIYLLSYITHVLLLPLSLLGKLETLYIYFGVAAFIGLLAGAILYFSSQMLVSVFDMNGTSTETQYAANSVGGRRQARRQEDAPQTSRVTGRNDPLPWYDEALERDGMGHLGQPRGRKKGLLSQTILEEDSEGSLTSSERS